jgi:hypothetical protein
MMTNEHKSPTIIFLVSRIESVYNNEHSSQMVVIKITSWISKQFEIPRMTWLLVKQAKDKFADSSKRVRMNGHPQFARIIVTSYAALLQCRVSAILCGNITFPVPYIL